MKEVKDAIKTGEFFTDLKTSVTRGLWALGRGSLESTAALVDTWSVMAERKEGRGKSWNEDEEETG